MCNFNSITFLGLSLVLSAKGGNLPVEDVVCSTLSPTTETTCEATFSTTKPPASTSNPCEDADLGIANVVCFVDGVVNAFEQAGGDVTEGNTGERETAAIPITTAFYEAGLCPVNVHWHLGAEHKSEGQYSEDGTGPTEIAARRRLAGKANELGGQCFLYSEDDTTMTTEYNWKYCTDMEVGQTYEVHWPHSKGGACGTLDQYQTPFKDGVFCDASKLDTSTPGVDGFFQNLSQDVGVQAQVFVVVNDEDFYYPDLMRGMIVDGDYGNNLSAYTGSTTGSSLNNVDECSGYTPITWQVDRDCHKISASSFDKLCADMLSQRDDMSEDVYPHGSREVVLDTLLASNLQELP